MKRLYLIGISFLALISCDSDQSRNDYVEPDIARENFIPVLVDLHVIESHYHRMYSRPDIYKQALDSASQIIFDKHEITREEYSTALEMYSYSSDTIYKIYEAAMDTITIRISTIQ
ncbi:MAG: DUF4296 domain-containing protein [Crocinitomicaceae bacterium]|nr:DUF4296 domain-containing protein [Crocinitomicaceae bacterium]